MPAVDISPEKPSSRPFRIVAIGGGTGLSTLLAGLSRHACVADGTIELTAIVTVTDDGQSSGRIRREFAVLPPGDIRNCLVALAPEENEITALFRHRFPGEGPLGGHSLGNLLLLGLTQLEGDLLAAIETARSLLGIDSRVLPSTLTPVDLVASVGGETIRGQIAIKSRRGPIRNLRLEPSDARAIPAAVEALMSADLITLGPGSLFTSVIANLLVSDLAAALRGSAARKLYICNAMTEFDETDGFSAEDHLRVLLSYVPGLSLDYALFNSSPISEEMRGRYARERAVALAPPAAIPVDLRGVSFLAMPLASESLFVRHDSGRLGRAIVSLLTGHGSMDNGDGSEDRV